MSYYSLQTDNEIKRAADDRDSARLDKIRFAAMREMERINFITGRFLEDFGAKTDVETEQTFKYRFFLKAQNEHYAKYSRQIRLIESYEIKINNKLQS